MEDIILTHFLLQQVKTIVLMAMRRIEDEELFSNYSFIGRLSPKEN